MAKMLCFMVWCVVFLCVPVHMHAQQGSVLRAIENEVVSILESNRQGVVRIHALFAPEQNASGSVFTHGSGFVFDARGYILTIDAAVEGAEEIRVTLATEKQVRARLVGSDPISGVAVIQVDDHPLPVLKMGDSDRIRFGHYAFILGNDFGNLVPTFGTMHEIFQSEDLIQVSARVQSSYGGAPVFCSDGQVGGMVWRYQDTASGYTPMEQFANTFMGVPGMPSSVFMIPINRALRVAKTLVAEGQMVYGWLGVEVGMQGDDVVVLDVAHQSPAAKSGVLPGDVLLAFGDRAVSGPHHLRRLVMESAPGDQVVLGVRRDGRILAQSVALGEMPNRPVVASQAPAMVPEDEMIFRQMDHLQKEMVRLRQLLHEQK